MPVVAHPKLPSIDRLADQGMVLTPEQALENAYDNELHIGLLNPVSYTHLTLPTIYSV